MIVLYSGTPGSGKTYCSVLTVLEWLRGGKYVISNVRLNFSGLRDGDKLSLRYLYVPWQHFDLQLFYDWAKCRHKVARENQTLVVIDEAQRTFNAREFQRGDRAQWVTFFSEHRHYGYSVLMIAQNDRMIDRQIRSLVEYEYVHRRVQVYLRWLPGTTFTQIMRWYGVREKLGQRFVRLRPSVANLYNTFAMGVLGEIETMQEKNVPGRLKKLIGGVKVSWLRLLIYVVCACVGGLGLAFVLRGKGGF